MERDKLEKLTTACYQFYLNKRMNKKQLADEEFDKLRKEYESEGGSLKNLIEWPKGLEVENIPEDKVDKTVVTDNDLSTAAMNDLRDCLIGDHYYCNLKYDGGALKIIYDERGRLKRIQSTPFADMGIVRTEQFYDLVPHQIYPTLGIQCIRCEVVVDANVWGKTARNKANGLINSVESQEEIRQEAFLRYYSLQYFDEDWKYERQWKDLLTLQEFEITRSRKRVVNWDGDTPIYGISIDKVFGMAPRFTADQSPTNSLMKLGDEPTFQCDGVVVYCQDYVYAYKFYYTDSAITTVNDIKWQDQPNGGWSAVVSIDPIELDGKYIQKASSNGVPNMIAMKMGVGAKVKVILAGTTIPKIVEVLEPSEEFNFPKCECGYQLTAEDVFGGTIKCGNQDLCMRKLRCNLRNIIESLCEDDWWEPFDECNPIKDAFDIFYYRPQWIGHLFLVDRFNADNALRHYDDPEYEYKLIGPELVKCITQLNSMEMRQGQPAHWDLLFKEQIAELYNFTDLQWANFEINSEALRVALVLTHKWTQDNFRNAKESLDKGEEIHIREFENSKDFIII